ncbi:MAG: C_GCAxxG_C_C family protein [Ruminococcaceae bacterium]|nr:C_GCAxxG_C_C family protein [Oscillospiraceae bacterium]
MSKYEEKARGLFLEGYNCAQAVFLAFEDVTGIDRETAAKLSSSFGGGMGRMREVCGAVSGMFMVLGCLHGYDDPKATTEKMDHYELIRKAAEKFKAENGSIICRDILEGATPGGAPEERTEQYYKKRPCAEYVAQCAAIVEEYIKEHKVL